VAPRESFNNVCGHRVGSLPKLSAELEPLERRKLFDRQLMEFDEEVVGALPRDKRLVSWRQCTKSLYNRRAASFPPPAPSGPRLSHPSNPSCPKPVRSCPSCPSCPSRPEEYDSHQVECWPVETSFGLRRAPCSWAQQVETWPPFLLFLPLLPLLPFPPLRLFNRLLPHYSKKSRGR
jgi:hypothetical protein